MPHEARFLWHTAAMPEHAGPVLLLDSASLYYRSFHALPESMTAPDGRPHNAVRGFLSTVTRLVDEHAPNRVVPCWDDDWRPQRRVDLVPTYKAQRVAVGDDPTAEAEPESLGAQAEAIAGLLRAAGLAPLGRAGFEADDVIASVAAQESRPVVVVSGDRDLVQVVAPGTRLLLTVNGGMDKWPLLDEAGVLERFAVAPARYVDLAVLRGDPSDGLPGVPGIGAKTAAILVSAFGDVEAILLAAEQNPSARPMTPRLAAALLGHADPIRAARVVSTAVDTLDVLPAGGGERDSTRLAELAEEWGVQRQVEALMGALARASGGGSDR